MRYSYQCRQGRCQQRRVELVRSVDQRDDEVRCQCGAVMFRVLWEPNRPPAVATWPPPCAREERRPGGGLHLEHVSAEGKTFYSRQEVREYCKANNLRSGAE